MRQDDSNVHLNGEVPESGSSSFSTLNMTVRDWMWASEALFVCS